MAQAKKSANRPADLTGIGHLIQEGRLGDAFNALRQFLQHNPYHAQGLCLMGDILRAQSQFEPAQEYYQRSLSIQQSAPALHGLLGVAEARQDMALGERCLRALTRVEPNNGFNHFWLAMQLKVNPATAEEAMSCLQKCINLGYQAKEAYYHIGCIAQSVLKKRDRDLARAAFMKALEIDPNYVDGVVGLAELYCDNNHIEEAIRLLQKLMAAGEQNANLFNLLAISLLKLGRHRECLDFMRQAIEAEPEQAELFSSYLFSLTYSTLVSEEEWLAEHKRYGAMVARKAQPYTSYPQQPDPQRKLRIGFVSGDFKDHSVNYFFEPLLRELDRQRVEVFCYSNDLYRDAVTMRIESMCNGWRNIATVPDQEAAQLIHADQIDVLIDLSVHSAKNRLPMFAWRPAPVQISWLGYPATTGMDSMDYIILDRHYLPPPGNEPFAVERILQLESYRVFQEPADMHKLEIRPLPALEKGYITFGSFNDFVKIDSHVLDRWVELLKRLPTARLAMIVRAQESLQYVQEYFTQRGIAAERLMLFTRLKFGHFLQLHWHVDLALDTSPFTGLTTSIHGLWMGVPTLTLAGARTTSRSGASMLAALDLDGFVAESEQDYLDKACYWAEHLPQLAEIRAGLRERLQGSILMDAPRFARDFEAGLRRCWQEWCVSQTGNLLSSGERSAIVSSQP